jgi:hypothetical protein
MDSILVICPSGKLDAVDLARKPVGNIPQKRFALFAPFIELERHTSSLIAIYSACHLTIVPTSALIAVFPGGG